MPIDAECVECGGELVSRYDGEVRTSENEPRGTVFSIELNRT